MAGLTKDEMDAILKQSKPFEERTPPAASSAPEGSVTLEPTRDQYTGAVLSGATEGVTKGLGFSAGAAGGLRAGLAVAPAATAVLALQGLLAHQFLGRPRVLGLQCCSTRGLTSLSLMTCAPCTATRGSRPIAKAA